MYTHTCVITQLVHTQLVHTHNFLTHNLSTHNLLTHNLSFLTSTFVTGVALGDIHLRFTWQAWHLVTSTFVARGRRGTYSTGRALVAHRVLMAADAVDAAALCVAGVALGDIHLRFTWQAWHLVTSTFVSRGRRGTWSNPDSFHVAGVALGHIHIRFTWQAWHLQHWAGSGGAPGSHGS